MGHKSLCLTAALALVAAMSFQLSAAPVARAAGPVNPVPPNSSTTAQSGWVFITQQISNALNKTMNYVWYPTTTNAVDPPIQSLQQNTAIQSDAVAFRTADGYIYGIQTAGGAGGTKVGVLVQIYPDGTGYTTVALGVPSMTLTTRNSATGFDAATFGAYNPDGSDTSDIMYVMAGGDGILYELDFGHMVSTADGVTQCWTPSTTCLPTVSTIALNTNGQPMFDPADLFWLDGYLWGVHTQNCSGNGTNCAAYIYRINTTTGVVDEYPLGAIDGQDIYAQHGYGSQWVYPDGTFGVSGSNGNAARPADVFRCSIANPGTTPTFTCVTAVGPVYVNDNDGTSNGVSTDMLLNKTASLDPNDPAPTNALTSVVIGNRVYYTITITNDPIDPPHIGNSTGWQLSDPLPSGLDLNNLTIDPPVPSASGSTAACSFDRTTLTLNCYNDHGPLPVHETVIIRYSAPVASFGAACSPLVNTATLTAYSPSAYRQSNATVEPAASVCQGPLPVVDLGVSKQVIDPATNQPADTAIFKPGDTATFEVTVKNASTSTADALSWTVTDPIPTGLTVDMSTVSLNPTGTNVACQLRADDPSAGMSTLYCGSTTALAPDHSQIITYSATVDATAPINLDNVVLLDGGVKTDTATVQVVPTYDLAVDKQVVDVVSGNPGPSTSVSNGDKVTFQVKVTNNSDVPVDGWTVTDQLPSGLTLDTSFTPVPGNTTDSITLSCDLTVNPFTCTGTGDLSPGNSVTITYQAIVTLASPVTTQTTLTNAVSVSETDNTVRTLDTTSTDKSSSADVVIPADDPPSTPPSSTPPSSSPTQQFVAAPSADTGGSSLTSSLAQAAGLLLLLGGMATWLLRSRRPAGEHIA